MTLLYESNGRVKSDKVDYVAEKDFSCKSSHSFCSTISTKSYVVLTFLMFFIYNFVLKYVFENFDLKYVLIFEY